MPIKTYDYQRVVSLTAALTETLYAIGVGDRVAGVTDTCDFPQEVEYKPNVSCWFAPDMDKILALRPDLVLGLTTAHQDLRVLLEEAGITTILLNPVTVDESLNVMMKLGKVMQQEDEAGVLVAGLQRRLETLEKLVAGVPATDRFRVVRVLDIDGDDLIVAGPKSFQYDVIKRSGGLNVTWNTGEAYPKVSSERFCRWQPEMIFFCGTDKRFVSRFSRDARWQGTPAVQSSRVYQFDCALTCRTGPRIVDMAVLLFDTLYSSVKN